MPQAAIAQSIAVAAMPTFSTQVALGKLGEMRSSLAKSLRGVLLLSIPASIGLMLLAKPIVAFLYQRGEFDAFSTDLVSWALLWYGLGLVGHAIVEILSRAFYALHDTRTPVTIGAMAMGINVILSVLLSRLFGNLGWMPHGGLALANTVATTLEAFILYILMSNRLDGIEGHDIFAGAVRALLAGGVMAVIIWLWVIITTDSPVWFVTIGGVSIGGLFYIVLILFFRVEEARLAYNFLRNKLG